MRTIDIDIAFDEGTIDEAMAEGPLAGLAWHLVTMEGPAGWPIVRVQVPDERWAAVSDEWGID